MGRFAVAVPAAGAGTGFVIVAGNLNNVYKADQFEMAADAVLLNHIDARLLDSDHLGLSPGGKNGSMAKAVHRLEQVGSDEIVLRNMAVVAGSPFAVAAVAP